MLAIEKVFSSLLSFPGLFLLIALFITVYLFTKKQPVYIRLISLGNLIMMFILFTSIGTNFLVLPLERIYLDTGFGDYQEEYPIVVLGGGIKYAGENSVLSPYSLQRLVKGLELYHEKKRPLILSGGVAIGQDGFSEARLAAQWLEKMGVDREDIIIEDQSRTTYENALYTKKYLEEYIATGWSAEPGGVKVYLVTNALHLPRAVRAFRKQGIEVIPVSSGVVVDHSKSWLSYLPNRDALCGNLMAIHEWFGLLWYKITGRI